MPGVTDAKGLPNLRTATTQRIRARPPQRGTAHLDMYLLSKEKERLEQELAHLEKRRERLQRHMAEIVGQLLELRRVAQQEEKVQLTEGVDGTAIPPEKPPREDQPRWKTMPLEY